MDNEVLQGARNAIRVCMKVEPVDPLGHWTGSDWSSKTHVDIVNPSCTVEVDGKLLMNDGHFVF